MSTDPLPIKRAALSIALVLSVCGLVLSLRTLLIEATVPYQLWLKDTTFFSLSDVEGGPPSLLSPDDLPWIFDVRLVHGGYSECTRKKLQAQAVGNDAAVIQAKLDCLHILKIAVENAPTDGKLWFEIARHTADLAGVTSNVVRALENSYRTAPREGWIARHRLQFALHNWKDLPEATKDKAIRDALNPWDQLDLGIKLYVEQSAADKKRAISLLRQAGENGDSHVLKDLGQRYLTGDGVPLDPEYGRAQLKKSIRLGNNDARARLGEALIRGIGTKKDVSGGLQLMEEAASIDDWGKYFLAKILLSNDVPKNVARAVQLLKNAAEHENFYAMELLSDLYESGEDVPRDSVMARVYAERAAPLRLRHDQEKRAN